MQGCCATDNFIASAFKSRNDVKHRLPGRIEKIKEVLLHDMGRFYQEVQNTTLNYVKSNHLRDINIGAYSYKTGGRPVLYASCYAALTMHLYGVLDHLSHAERKEWADYIQNFQQDDGIFAIQ